MKTHSAKLIQAIEEMQSIIASASGEPASVRDAEADYSAIIDKLPSVESMNTQSELFDIADTARSRLQPDTLNRLAKFPADTQVRILFLLTCSERQIVWEAQGGNLPEEAFAVDQKKKALDKIHWHLQQSLNIGEYVMDETKAAEIRTLRDTFHQRADELPVVRADHISRYHIARIINDADPADRPHIMTHRIASTGKTGPKTDIFRAAAVRLLAAFTGDTSAAGKQLIADLFNDFHRDNPDVPEITLPLVKRDLHDRL